MKYNLFLDDMRNPTDAWLYDQKTKLIDATEIDDWVIVRNYDEFVTIVRCNGIPSVVSFDHDLHFEHIRHYCEVVQKLGIIDYINFKHKTGLACAQYLIDACREKDTPLPKCYVHSANEIGRENIKKLLEIL
jgi:hypothetical protein